jgi:hypothetical protein
VKIPREIWRFVINLWWNFFDLGVILGLIGLNWKWYREWKNWLGFLLIFFANGIFYINYHVLDTDTMSLPAFLVWAIWIREGVSGVYALVLNLLKGLPRRSLIGNIVQACLAGTLVLAVALNFPWLDMSRNQGELGMIQDVLATAEPGSTVIDQWS